MRYLLNLLFAFSVFSNLSAYSQEKNCICKEEVILTFKNSINEKVYLWISDQAAKEKYTRIKEFNLLPGEIESLPFLVTSGQGKAALMIVIHGKGYESSANFLEIDLAKQNVIELTEFWEEKDDFWYHQPICFIRPITHILEQ